MLRLECCVGLLALAHIATQDKSQPSHLVLRGKSDRMVSGDRVEIETKGGATVMKARWTTASGRGYSLEATMSPEDWKLLTEDMSKAGKLANVDEMVSHATDWVLEVTAGGATQKFTARAPDLRADAPLSKVIFRILESRDQYLAYARVDGPRDEGTMRIKETARSARILIPSEAQRRAAYLKKGQFDEPMEVLQCGQCRNREIVEALVSLLDHKDPVIASAACAPLSWASGEKPTADKAAWKAWWSKNKETYRAYVEEHGTGTVGGGTVRALAGYAAGLDCIDIDADGAIWGIVEQGRDSLELQAYDVKKDAFSPAGDRYACIGDSVIEWSTRFRRQIVRSKIALPRCRWAGTSRSGDVGIVVVGSKDNEFDYKAVIRIDFKSGTKEHLPLKHRQIANPVITDDGKLFAVAEAEGWARPNWVAIYDAKGELVALPKIEREDNLNPIGFAKGLFYFERCSDRDDATLEIWTYDLETKAAGKLVEYTAKERVWTGPMTSDGRMVIRRGKMGALHLGFLELKSKEFTPITFAAGEIDDFSVAADGSRVVFLADGEPFEWTKK